MPPTVPVSQESAVQRFTRFVEEILLYIVKHQAIERALKKKFPRMQWGDIEDLASDVRIDLLEHITDGRLVVLRSLGNMEKLDARTINTVCSYAKTIAFRTASKFIKKQVKNRIIPVLELDDLRQPETLPCRLDAFDSFRENREAFFAALNTKLSDHESMVFALTLHGMTRFEVARVLRFGKNRNKVTPILNEAKRKIAMLLEEIVNIPNAVSIVERMIRNGRRKK